MITTGIDWDKWRRIPNPKLWEAALLLMGIDPDRYVRVGNPAYERQLRMLSANYWEIEGKPNLTGKDPSPNALVSLSRCARWAAAKELIPPELAAIAAQKPVQQETSNKSASGFAKKDREYFPAISRMIKDGSRSAYGAALSLAEGGELTGAGTPQSRAKRVSQRFKREWQTQ